MSETCSYIQQKNQSAELPMYKHDADQNCSFERSKYIPHVLDAVYAVSMAVHNMLGCQPEKSCRHKLNSTIQDRYD